MVPDTVLNGSFNTYSRTDPKPAILDKSLGTLLGLSLKSPPLPLDQC